MPVLALVNVHFSQNTADSGGAIFQQNGYLVSTNCSFIDNLSDAGSSGPGGAVRMLSTSTNFFVAEFTSCTFESNGAGTAGGAVSLDAANANLSFYSTLFQDNSATLEGSAMHIEDNNAATGTVS